MDYVTYVNSDPAKKRRWTSRQGIIKNVPTDISNEEIKKEVNNPFEIANVRHLNRKIINSSESDSTTMKGGYAK
ncbi:hypothetical protein RF55_18246 [Lasius niger]|uniref:Uncharacterized protein n=1 Tax=Lasius niger TaxID=67767 RepID=A0A0J7K172_LASNI|nr:hypothetical protein RF55_18246 [Lasius niger]